MDKLVFLDTETTGNNPLFDRLFEVAYKHKDKTVCEYFKPPVPISVKSSSITHVTNEDVKDSPEFLNSSVKKELEEILKDNILVAHSAEFDIEALSKEGLEVPQFICTLKVARYLDEECEIPEYGLQYLRYYHKLDVKDAYAHDAGSDIKVLEALFYKLFDQMREAEKKEEEIINEMIRISNQPILFKFFGFGKHKGKKIEDVAIFDRGYLEWLLDQKLQSNQAEEDWIFTLKHHLQIKD